MNTYRQVEADSFCWAFFRVGAGLPAAPGCGFAELSIRSVQGGLQYRLVAYSHSNTSLALSLGLLAVEPCAEQVIQVCLCVHNEMLVAAEDGAGSPIRCHEGQRCGTYLS